MTKPKALVLLILLCATFAYAQEGDQWVKFSSPEGRFSMLVPHTPKYEMIPNGDPKESPNHRYQDLEAGYGFICEYADIDVGEGVTASMLDQTRDALLSGAKGTKLGEKEMKIEGYSAREIEMSFADVPGVTGTTRFFIAGNRFYSLSFVRRNDLDAATMADISNKFFSSFRLLRATN
jgi:hypothetical protein